MIMSKGSILTISLKPHLADFCRHEMRQDKEGNIILSRKSDIGKHIYSMVMTSDMPVKGLPCTDPVSFIIPVTGPTSTSSSIVLSMYQGGERKKFKIT